MFSGFESSVLYFQDFIVTLGNLPRGTQADALKH